MPTAKLACSRMVELLSLKTKTSNPPVIVARPLSSTTIGLIDQDLQKAMPQPLPPLNVLLRTPVDHVLDRISHSSSQILKMILLL